MWAATIDFMKAFDSITHKSIWDALKSCGIEHEYIHLLTKLYRDQTATLQSQMKNVTCLRSRKEPSKQGDPLSSLFFNTVLQKALDDDTSPLGESRRFFLLWRLLVVATTGGFYFLQAPSPE